MLAGLRTYAQSLANSLMETTVVIRHRATPAKDPTNPNGDEDILFESTTTTVLGWFVDPSTASIQDTGGMSTVVDKPTVRVPVGTRIDSRDEVTINGDIWVVIDASSDETWPAMLKVGLVREQ